MLLCQNKSNYIFKLILKLEFTPYICILFLLQFHYSGFAQNSKTLIIKGANEYSTTIIQQIAYQKNISSDSLINVELKEFGHKLNRLGYLQHHIESIQKTDSTYIAKYLLNQNTNFVKIRHPKIAFLNNNKKLDQIDNRTVLLAFDKLDKLIQDLIEYYQNNGYPFIKFYFENIRTEEEIINLDLMADRGLKRTIDSIIIKGYEKFPVSFTKQYLKIHIGDDFSKNKIKGISNNIQKLPFVSEIKKPEVLFTTDRSSLYLYLKKENNSSFDGLLGIASSGKDKSLKLNGYLNLKIENALNYGERLDLKWLSDGNQSQSLKLGLFTPYILQSPFSSKYELDIYKQDSTFITIKNYLSLGYQLKKNQLVSLTLSQQNSNHITNQSTPDIIDFSSIFYGLSYRIQKPNNNPIFKTKFQLITHVAQGKRNEVKQNTLSNAVSILWNISNTKNIVLKNNTALLFSTAYFTNELFRLGGIGSIRGFDENSLIAKSYSYINLEYNYLINSSSYISTLSDFGLLNNTLSDSTLKVYSFGVGYTTKSKIGTIGIQYFIGNSSENPFSLNNSKLHIKLSQSF